MKEKLSQAMIVGVPSPYPASFDGSTLRYTLALFSLMSIAIVGWMVVSWMAREIWHGRRDAYPFEPLFAMRGVFALAALTAALRASPEAAMMITWRENPAVAGIMLGVKRWCDAGAFAPAMLWMGTIYIYYPQICTMLVRVSRSEGHVFRPTIPKERIRTLRNVLMLILAISTLIAIGKRW